MTTKTKYEFRAVVDGEEVTPESFFGLTERDERLFAGFQHVLRELQEDSGQRIPGRKSWVLSGSPSFVRTKEDTLDTIPGASVVLSCTGV